MKSNFKTALDLVLMHEGGYVNHPQDPGGATNKGVTQRVYDSYRRRGTLPLRSVKQITTGEVQEIYRTGYWNKVSGDDLPKGLDYCVFDGAVNSGPYQSIKWLQASINEVGNYRIKVDGIIGPVTLDMAETCSQKLLIDEICNRRMSFLQGLRHWGTFSRGWTRRVSGVRNKAKEMTGLYTPPERLEPVRYEVQRKSLIQIIIEVLKAIFR